ncbi:MAG: DUF3501 family protein [Gammaproteobacteria bacterium]|jgi:hypothetical protein|nr:DUF3501 family protein [Gammaproteobacteria bacterium]MBT7603143.1 DUF3501 family protein [Gammaproteobacteria bacterium]
MLKKEDLYKLEEYSEERNKFKEKVLEVKNNRSVLLGKNINLLFENLITIKYQIQEMLRIEKIFEPEAIQEELDTYNPLIPNGSNLKATMLIEYTDVSERRDWLQKLKGVEKKIWIKIGSNDPIFPYADEDLKREDENKTSAVHFLRWELKKSEIQDFKNGNILSMGVTHAEYNASHIISDIIRSELVKDLF